VGGTLGPESVQQFRPSDPEFVSLGLSSVSFQACNIPSIRGDRLQDNWSAQCEQSPHRICNPVIGVSDRVYRCWGYKRGTKHAR